LNDGSKDNSGAVIEAFKDKDKESFKEKSKEVFPEILG
jgi:hypothetical protein